MQYHIPSYSIPSGGHMPSFEDFSDAQFRAALESGETHYRSWQGMVRAAQAAANAKAAAATAYELQFCSEAQRPAEEELPQDEQQMQPEG